GGPDLVALVLQQDLQPLDDRRLVVDRQHPVFLFRRHFSNLSPEKRLLIIHWTQFVGKLIIHIGLRAKKKQTHVQRTYTAPHGPWHNAAHGRDGGVDILETHVSPASAQFRANAERMTALVNELRERTA